MKVFVFGLVVCFASWASSWDFSDLEKYKPVQLVLNSNMLQCNLDRNLNLDVSEIKVYFYDFSRNETNIFSIGDAAKEILALKTLDKTKKIVTFVGGFRSEINKENEEKVRNAYKSNPNDYFIMLDHSVYTNNKQGNRKSYERSVTYVPYIGKALGKMLAGLHHGGMSPKNMHCVGHSLGGQMLGYAGDEFLKITGEKMWRISALDPAGPCFFNGKIVDQVRSGLAEYVEVYHCNAGAFGSSSVLGDVDFFINKNGETQPNCGYLYVSGVIDSALAAVCSHNMCIDIWAASVRRPDSFPAWKCDSYSSFDKGGCSANARSVAGPSNPGNATGVYYLSTEGVELS